MSLYSFILIYFYIFRHLFEESAEYCLVDITYEATEIGIVRDGILSYTTHTAFGSFSLAREIATILDIPLEEAFGYMHTEDPLTLLQQYSPEKIADVKEVFKQYEGRLSSLFHETGDVLAIPKRIFLHGNLESEAFFSKRVGEGARLATNTSHAIYSASAELAKRKYPEELVAKFSSEAVDTALLISAQFFHTKTFHSQFEQM
jgi:Tfp pilus assembly PilM family ATPase